MYDLATIRRINDEATFTELKRRKEDAERKLAIITTLQAYRAAKNKE